MINENIFNFIPEEDHQRAMENLQKGMKGKQIKRFQIPMIAKSGERLFFESFGPLSKTSRTVILKLILPATLPFPTNHFVKSMDILKKN